MNCHDIATLLDERDMAELEDAERRALQSHLDGCPDCAGDWDAHARLLRQSVSALPAGLAERIWRSIESGEPAQRHWLGGPLLGVGILLAGAAALSAWHRLENPSEHADLDSDTAVERQSEPAPSLQPEETDSVAAAAGSAVPARSEPEPAVPDPGTEPAPWTRLIVLPARVQSADPRAVSFAGAVRQAFLEELRLATKLDVVDADAPGLAVVVPASAGDPYEDPTGYLALTRHYGGGYLVEVDLKPIADGSLWSIFTRLRDLEGSGSRAGFGTVVRGNDGPRPGDDPTGIGSGIADSIAEQVPRLTPSTPPDPSVVDFILDTTQSEEERARVLSQISASAFSGAVVDAAIELGTRAESAGTRQRVWALARKDYYEPTLAQPLAYVLASDPDAGVRREAALALGAYLDDAVTLPALESAIASDRSTDVRLAARLSSLSFDDRRTLTQERLLDSSLTPEERFATLSMGPVSLPEAQADRWAHAFAEIASATDDPEIERLAVNGITTFDRQLSLDPYIRDVLLECLESEDRTVRVVALGALQLHADDLKVRAALDRTATIPPQLE